MSAPAAVVVAWRAGERAATCLDRLAEAAPGVARVLVDGESDPDALGRLLATRPGVEAVPLARNPGFAGGANAGVERAFAQGASHALLLNDDVLVEPGCLEALVAAAGEARCTAPELDGDDPFAGAAIDWSRGFGRHEHGATDYLTGAALCIPRPVWERVGPFDEQLFLYYEDVDWCVRARAAGVPLQVVPEARAAHAGGASTGGAAGDTWAYYSTRNRLWFLERHRGHRAADIEAARTLARAVGRAATGKGQLRPRLAGVRDWHARRMGKGPYPA